MTNPRGCVTEYEYDGAHRRTKTRVIDPSVAAQHLVTEFGYDGADNVIQIDFPNGNIGNLVYDKVNRLTLGWDDLGTNGAMQYDANGNVIWLENGEGERWSFEYDPVDRLKKLYDPIIEMPTDKFTEYQYDKRGLRTRTINAKGIVTKYTYDKINRMVTLTEDFGGTNQASTSWDYNGPGWVNWMKDNEQNQTSYLYDGAGRVTQVVYPDLGDVDFTYYAAGGVHTRTDQKQVVTTYTRDDLHRMTARSYSTGGSDSFVYDKSGRLTQASNSLVQVDLGYDGMGRLDSETQTFAGTATPYVVGFAYNMGPAAWTQTTTYPGGRSVTRSYDERFRIGGVNGGANVGADWSYDLADRRTGAALGNGIGSLFEYDDNGRMTHLKHAVSGNPIYELGYGYDAVGNRVYKEDMVNSTRSEFYEYDNRDRLRRFKRGTLAPTKDSITEVAHATLPSLHGWYLSDMMDSRGNWLQFTRRLNNVVTWEARTVNGVNEYTSVDMDSKASPPDPVVPGYDDNGNLTADPTAPNAGGQAAGQAYTYDVENRLTQVTRAAGPGAPGLEVRYDLLDTRRTLGVMVHRTGGEAAAASQGAGGWRAWSLSTRRTGRRTRWRR